MKTYDEFHGNIELTKIGKILRNIVKTEKDNFKILTGYGSNTGNSKSKIAAIKSLRKMKKEGLIKGFLPGEVKYSILYNNSEYYETKLEYSKLISNDKDYGNEGIIFVFIN